MKLLDGLRRQVTRGATLAALRAAGALGCGTSRSLGMSVGRFAHLTPWLRERLVGNLRAAGMDASEATVRAYFRRFGLWAGHSLGVYGAGFDGSFVGAQIEFDPETVGILDAAVARGRGVVLAAPHVTGHELAAAVIHRRHPVTALVRESKDAAWGAVKERWYGAGLGVRTVLRPRKGSVAGDMGAMLRVLRGGGVLAITPDVPMGRGSGMPVEVFGRTVSLSPGMIVLAMRTGAALVNARLRWLPDPAHVGRERAQIVFSETTDLPKKGARDDALRDAVQRWFSEFESNLRRSPADWLFWLDKGWTKVLRGPATSLRRVA